MPLDATGDLARHDPPSVDLERRQIELRSLLARRRKIAAHVVEHRVQVFERPDVPVCPSSTDGDARQRDDDVARGAVRLAGMLRCEGADQRELAVLVLRQHSLDGVDANLGEVDVHVAFAGQKRPRQHRQADVRAQSFDVEDAPPFRIVDRREDSFESAEPEAVNALDANFALEAVVERLVHLGDDHAPHGWRADMEERAAHRRARERQRRSQRCARDPERMTNAALAVLGHQNASPMPNAIAMGTLKIDPGLPSSPWAMSSSVGFTPGMRYAISRRIGPTGVS